MENTQPSQDMDAAHRGLERERADRATAIQGLEDRVSWQLRVMREDIDASREIARCAAAREVGRDDSDGCTLRQCSTEELEAKIRALLMSSECSLRQEISVAEARLRADRVAIQDIIMDLKSLSESRWNSMQAAIADADMKFCEEAVRLDGQSRANQAATQEFCVAFDASLRSLELRAGQEIATVVDEAKKGTTALERLIVDRTASLERRVDDFHLERIGAPSTRSDRLPADVQYLIEALGPRLRQEVAELGDLIAEHKHLREGPSGVCSLGAGSGSDAALLQDQCNALHGALRDVDALLRAEVCKVSQEQRAEHSAIRSHTLEQKTALDDHGAHLQKVSSVMALLLASQEEMSGRLKRVTDAIVRIAPEEATLGQLSITTCE